MDIDGRQVRDSPGAPIQIRKQGGERTAMTFPLTSDARIERWYGTEILSQDPKAIRMERANAGAVPLLFNHDWSDPIGMVSKMSVHDDGRLWVDEATLFDTDRAREVETMIDGGLRNVSAGYQMHVVEEDIKTNTYTATDWEPLEASIVTVPADIRVGIGRQQDDKTPPPRLVRVGDQPAQAATTKGADMPDGTTAAAGQQNAGQTEAPKIGAVEAEKERREAIVNLCKSNRIDDRVRSQWIEDGTPLTVVAKELLDVMEERGKQDPTTASNIGLSNKDTKRYSVFKAIRALHYGAKNPQLIREAAFEMECSQQLAKQLNRSETQNILVPGEVLTLKTPEMAQRAMATSPGSKGGYLVNVENMGFIDILRNRSVAMNMGARVLSGLVGNVTFPRQTGKGTVTWQAGEHVSVTAADQAIGQLSMTPKTAVAITDVSEQLLRQSTPSAEAFVMADLAACVAVDGVDAAAINGTGGAQPLGIKNTTGITSGQSASTFSYTKALAFPVAAGAVNAIRGNPGWVTNIAGAAICMQRARFSNTDTPIWEGNLMNGTLVGFRAMSSEQLASANIIFGSWDELVIGEWGVLELATDTGGTRFNTLTVGIRAMWMVDVLLRYPQAFVVGTDLS